MKTKLVNTELTIEMYDRTIIIDVHKQPFESLFTLDNELYTVRVNDNEITINKA